MSTEARRTTSDFFISTFRATLHRRSGCIPFCKVTEPCFSTRNAYSWETIRTKCLKTH